jgi:hypothetical protein
VDYNNNDRTAVHRYPLSPSPPLSGSWLVDAHLSTAKASPRGPGGSLGPGGGAVLLADWLALWEGREVLPVGERRLPDEITLCLECPQSEPAHPPHPRDLLDGYRVERTGKA